MENQNKKIWEKILSIQKSVDSAKKTGLANITKKQSYKYFQYDNMLSIIRRKCDEINVVVTFHCPDEYSLVPSDAIDGVGVKYNLFNFLTKLKMIVRDLDSGEFLEFTQPTAANDRYPHYALGKAMTYGKRYLLLNVFLFGEKDNLETEEPPKTN